MNIFNLTGDFLDTQDFEQPYYTQVLGDMLQDEQYANYGLGSIDWDSANCPILYSMRTQLTARFNDYYQFREIGSETESRWQKTIQRQYNIVKNKFELQLSLYQEATITRLGMSFVETLNLDRTRTDDLTTKNDDTETTVLDGTHVNTGAYRTENKTKNYDTPVTQASLNNDGYLTGGSNEEGSTTLDNLKYDYDDTTTLTRDNTEKKTGTQTNTGTDTKTREVEEGSRAEMIQKFFEAWEDVSLEFIRAFESCFINEIARI